MEKRSDTPREGPHDAILQKIRELYLDLFQHNGFGELKVSMRFLKKGQKEIIVVCGKEYRFVLDYPEACRRPSH
jgi:hypothetical protein